MIKIKVREGEPIDRALKRLKKSLKDEGVLDAVRQRRYFTPKSCLLYTSPSPRD